MCFTQAVIEWKDICYIIKAALSFLYNQICSGNLYREKRQKKNIKTLTALGNTLSTLDLTLLKL